MTYSTHLALLLFAIGSSATFAAEVTPTPPPLPSATTPSEAGAVTPSAAPQADAAPAWQRPRVFLGALIEDGGSFDGKPMPRVTRLIAGSIFDKLGIKEGDQLAAFNGTPVTSSEIFRSLNAALKPGDKLQLTVVRDGVSREVTGTAEAPPRAREILADTEALKTQVTQLKDDVERAKVRTNLEETLRLLREFETGLPAAAAEFKRVYPGGTFNIQLHVDIRSEASDPTAKPLTPTPVSSPATPTSVTTPRSSSTITGVKPVVVPIVDPQAADLVVPSPPTRTAP